jgi:hypothetical protein
MNQPFNFYKSAITFWDGFNIRSGFLGNNNPKLSPKLPLYRSAFP